LYAECINTFPPTDKKVRGSNPVVSDNTGSSNDSDGYWVSKCRWVRVPNPNYQGGSSTSVNENIAKGPAYVSEQQCTDVFVSK
jgi:hypothetical protein